MQTYDYNQHAALTIIVCPTVFFLHNLSKHVCCWQQNTGANRALFGTQICSSLFLIQAALTIIACSGTYNYNCANAKPITTTVLMQTYNYNQLC